MVEPKLGISIRQILMLRVWQQAFISVCWNLVINVLHRKCWWRNNEVSSLEVPELSVQNWDPGAEREDCMRHKLDVVWGVCLLYYHEYQASDTTNTHRNTIALATNRIRCYYGAGIYTIVWTFMIWASVRKWNIFDQRDPAKFIRYCFSELSFLIGERLLRYSWKAMNRSFPPFSFYYYHS